MEIHKCADRRLNDEKALTYTTSPLETDVEITGHPDESIGDCLKSMAKELGIWRRGYKLLINVEQGAGQDIFHVHMHLMGGFNFGL